MSIYLDDNLDAYIINRREEQYAFTRKNTFIPSPRDIGKMDILTNGNF